MTRSWEEYHGGPNEPLRERWHVTLNRRCILLLNRKAAEAIGTPEMAMLLYDGRNKAIGVRAAGASDINPFPVLPHPKGSHFSIYMRPFCRHFGINSSDHIRFTAPEIDNDGVMVLDLNRIEPVERKKRKGGSQ